MKILLISHTDHYEDDLTKCKRFSEVQTFFVKKELEKNGVVCKVIPGEYWMGVKKRHKSIFQNYFDTFDPLLFKEFPIFLFVGAIPLKNTSPEIIRHLKENITGLFVELNEYKKNPKGDLIFFSLPDESSDTQICLGPMFDSTELYFQKQYNILKLHIDHHFPGRADAFELIRKTIQDLEKNEYFLKNWKGYEVYYHSKKIKNINDIDFYDVPPNIPFKQLSKIYRETHIGFLSHRETMGMYPIELSACGSVVAVPDKHFLKSSMFSIFNSLPINDSFWDEVLPKINQKTAEANINRVKQFSFENGVKKMLTTIKNFKC